MEENIKENTSHFCVFRVISYISASTNKFIDVTPDPGIDLGSPLQADSLVMSNSVTSWIAAHQASLSIISSRSLLKLMFIESVMPSNHLILCHPLLLLPSILPSIRVYSNESALCIRWPKYWSFSFNISPYNEYSGLISFRMDWLDLLAVQGTLESLLQYHIVWHGLNFWLILECWWNAWAFILNKSENRS